MADLSVKRGNTNNMSSVAKVDGQFLVGKEGTAITSFGMDYDDNGTLKRAIMKMPTIELTTAQLRASSWSSGRYSFENDYPFATTNLDISLAETATDTQIAAFSKAQIIADDTENTLIARGKVPSVNIPIKIEVEVK